MINILNQNIDNLISDLIREYIDKSSGGPYLNWNRLNPQEPLLRESLCNGQGFWLAK